MPTTTKYIWDEQNYLAEADGSDTINVVYTNEPQRYGNLISTRIANTASYHQFDALGSTRQLANSMAATTDAMVYDAWGSVVGRTGTTPLNLFWNGLIGYYRDVELNSHYVRARIYYPSNARWISVDPLGSPQSNALYIYCGNSPLFNQDPSGADNSAPVTAGNGWTTVLVGATVRMLDDYLASYSFDWNGMIQVGAIPNGVTMYWELTRLEYRYKDWSGYEGLVINYRKDVVPWAALSKAGTFTIPDTQTAMMPHCILTATILVTVQFGFPENKTIENKVPRGNSIPITPGEGKTMRDGFDENSSGSFDYTYHFKDLWLMRLAPGGQGFPDTRIFKCPCPEAGLDPLPRPAKPDPKLPPPKQGPQPPPNAVSPRRPPHSVIESIDTPWGLF